MQGALDEGYSLLKKGCSALESVTKAVRMLEDCELLNAGKGFVFTAKGEHELDAAIMDGNNLEAGAVAGIKDIKNPVLLARDIMEHTPYVFLAGPEAVEYARQRDFEIMPASYFHTEYRANKWKEIRGSGEVKLDHSSDDNEKQGTVGSVADDARGNLAAATSTGGMTNKAWGRIGDSPIIGAGTYADNHTCAVTCTGHGEYFIRGVIAYVVSCRMEYGKSRLEEAADKAIFDSLKNLGGEGGLIAVNAHGDIAMPFNTEGMYRGLKNEQRTFTQIL